MPDKGALLNNRVWQLFENAGFQTRPSSSDPKEEAVGIGPGKTRTVDLSASEPTLGVKIIGWNKARKDLRQSVTVDINDYATLLAPAKADLALLISTEKEFTAEDRQYAASKKAALWAKEDLDYYEVLVDALGHWAKYEILSALGLPTKEETAFFTVLAIRFRQPTPTGPVALYLFTAPPRVLLKTCTVLRKARGSKDAYQRILQKKRLSKIARFVAGTNSILPPNIIAYLGENVRWDPIPHPQRDASGRVVTLSRAHDYEMGLLTIPEKYASLELIDGQHRLYGFTGTDSATQDHFNLVVLGMTDIPAENRTDTFIAINDNARRVDANLVAFLKYTADEAACQASPELMAIKIAIELNSTSPFKKRIRLLDIGQEKITLKGFAGYDLKGLIAPRGLLRKHYDHQSSAYIAALRLYFGVLKSMFPQQWNHPEKYIMFANRGISAFLKLLKSILRTEKHPLTQPAIKKYLQPLRDKWPDSHWETASLSNAYVGSKGWKDFHRELVAVIRKKHKNFKE